MSNDRRSLPTRFVRVVPFFFFYVMEVVLSSLRIAADILTPKLHFQPGIIAIPLCELTDRQILVLSNLVTMTPGTLSLDISADRRTLFLHHMNVADIDRMRRQIQVDYVQRIKEIF
jgi:multicomponent Na+:H+ antiporter subunit E